MGCGSSKGVAPATVPAPAVSPLKEHQQAQGAAPASDAAALHKQRLEQQHSQKAQHEQDQGTLSLPGRIESSTAPAPPPLLKELPEVVDLPPLHKHPAKTAGDAEFDYDKELQRGAALGSGGGAPPVSTAQGAVVGGLLSKQPDWLRGSGTDPSTGTGKLPALTPAQGTLPAGKTVSSLPPLVGRGMGAAAAGGSSLPPLVAGGSRVLAPVGSQNSTQGAKADAEAPNARVSGSGSDAAGTKLDDAHKAHSQKQASSSSSVSSSRSSSPVAHAAAGKAAAAAQGHADPADPWNSLQNQYAHEHGSPSPDSSIAGGSPPAAIAPTNKPAAASAGMSSLPPLHSSTAAAPAGSRRTTGTKQPEQKQETVLVDSDNETADAKQPQQQQQQQKADSALAAAKTNKSSFSSASDGKISAQSSQHSVNSGVPHVAKSGGWGVGSLAGAGTIMLGDESPARKPGMPQVTPGAPAAAAPHDDVFGDDEAPVLPKGFGGNAAGLAAEGSSNLRGSHSRMRVGVTPAAQQETLDVEEIEDDVDAMIESEMARDGLPADLAAKLAQFEAMGADGESEDGGGSGGESPTIFAMMNNRQGSWRAS